MNRIAIFASGNGTNAQRIIDYFKESNTAISLIVCNKESAFVLKRAEKENIPTLLINKDMFYKTEEIVTRLLNEKIDLIVCAGFLWKIPDNILRTFYNKVINIHPALLPKFGGKGMYGIHVHKAVIEAGEKESGITIHYLNEHYDEGEVILQKKCKVEKNDTPEALAKKIHELEYEWYPLAIEKILTKE